MTWLSIWVSQTLSHLERAIRPVGYKGVHRGRGILVRGVFRKVRNLNLSFRGYAEEWSIVASVRAICSAM